MARKNHDQNAVRRYLLQQLSERDQESIEHRLLGDESLSEELDIVEDELIDEYVAGELSWRERRRFKKYFLAHPERRSKLHAGQALHRHLNPTSSNQPLSLFENLRRWVRQSFFSSPIGVATALPVIAVIAIAVWFFLIKQSDLQKGLLALAEAYRQERPIESRVSELDYAPFLATRGNAPANFNELERTRAERYLSDAYTEQPNAKTAHALGKFYLLQKDPDKAIQYLEQARSGDSRSAQINADLGAAYFEKGKLEIEKSGTDAGKDLSELGRSLEYLHQALELDPNLLDALFNRALVHQFQGLNHLAETDWRAYLQKDPNSPWATEAQRRLKELEEKKGATQNPGEPFDRFLQAYRARDESSAWEIYKSSHVPRGNSIRKALLSGISANQAEHIAALNYLAQQELRKTQDTYTSDLARVYGSASPEKHALLVQARKQMDEGYASFAQSKLSETKTLFTTARDNFAKAGSLPEKLSAEVALALAAVSEPDLVSAQKVFAEVIPACEQNNYKWLLAETLTRRAHLEANLNNSSSAIRDANQALDLFQKVDDPNGILGSLIQLGSLHLFLNDHELSFSYLRRALLLAERLPAPPGDIWAIHIATSQNLGALKLYRAALDYQHEALRIALEMSTPIHLSRSYQNIGLTYASLHQFDHALQNLRLAYAEGKHLENERNGQSMMANASLKLGDVFRASGDITNALTAYEESFRLYEALRFFHYSYAAHKGRFLSYLAQHNDALAEQELKIVLNLFDDYRQKILDERQKNYFFDREQDIYDLAIDFSYSRLNDPRRAFDYLEISRARNLRDLMHHGAQITLSDSGPDLRSVKDANSPHVLPLTANQVVQQLPERVQIVQFAVLEKKLLIWHVSRAGISPTPVEVESTQLAEAVASAVNQIRTRDDSSVMASLKGLYRLLIEPIKDKLDPSRVICFVPDKALHYVPFGALMSDSSGRFLFQDFRVMISPSATILIESSNSAKERTLLKGDEHLLAVGNPAFDRAANPKLSNLPGAEREVEKIAENYFSKRVLVANRATRKSVLSELGKADIAHFAAHYEVDSRSTLSSKLLLARDPAERAHAEPTGLTTADIYGMELKRTRLVILSACKTAVERDFGGEGPIGFARSFLVAGVPVVVASLWPVDSDATALLMIEFHRLRRMNLTTAEALQRAQDKIKNQRGYQSPYYWAGFMIVGGYGEY